MKHLLMLFVALITMNVLTGCTQSMGSSADTPSLSANSRSTSRVPSPGNYQGSTTMQSTTMMAPTSQ